MEQRKTEKKLINDTIEYVKKLFKDECPSHDTEHVLRVYYNAIRLQRVEGGDLFIISMGALLHDVEDYKLSKKPTIREWLEKNNLAEDKIQAIYNVVDGVSYSKNKDTVLETIEQKIVQDADRLDAIGAIGIARTFSYGGENGRPIYCEDESKADQVKNSSIAHFYDKLLLIKDKLNTESAILIADNRHQLLIDFMEQFFEEMTFSSEEDHKIPEKFL